MKKLTTFISLLLATAMLLTGCSTTETTQHVDDEIISLSEEILYEFQPEAGRTFSVYKDNDKIYHVDVNGDELLVKVDEPSNRHVVKSNVTEVEKTTLKVAASARKLLERYIQNSNILRDKDELVEYIENIPLKMADFSEGDNAGEYDLEQDVIFVNRAFKTQVCEWMLLHEYVHALCQKTNGGPENLRYPYDLFNEVITDIITAHLEPSITKDYQSGYSPYYELGYLYLGCMGVEGIEAYFYGYADILQTIPEDELDIFVASIDQIETVENAIVIAHNCINKWGLEVCR